MLPAKTELKFSFPSRSRRNKSLTNSADGKRLIFDGGETKKANVHPDKFEVKEQTKEGRDELVQLNRYEAKVVTKERFEHDEIPKPSAVRCTHRNTPFRRPRDREDSDSESANAKEAREINGDPTPK